MKNLITKIVFILFILFTFILLIIDCNSSYAQSDPTKEVLVYIKQGSINLPDSASQTYSTSNVGITSLNLTNLLDSFNVLGICRSFPTYTKSDTLVITQQGVTINVSPFSRIYTLFLSSQNAADSLVVLLSELTDDVVFAEKNNLNGVVSSDPDYTYQWYLKNTGTYGTPGADIKIEPVWNLGTVGILYPIGVFDTGVNRFHDDLTGRVSGDSWLGSIGQFGDIAPHGTEMSGIIGASHNDVFIKGVNRTTPINSYRVFENNNPISAIEYANKLLSASYHCYVINHSYTINWSQVIRLAYQYSLLSGKVNIASMGNIGDGWASYVSFPAMLNGVMAIGATNSNDNRASYSKYSYIIDLCAPGGEQGVLIGDHYKRILTTSISNTSLNTTALITGTSPASAMVTGVVSLMQNYRYAEREDIEGLLKISADDKGDVGWDEYYGYGRLNAERAFKYMRTPYTLLKYPSTGNTISGGVQNGTQTNIVNPVSVSGASPLGDGTYYLRETIVYKTVNFTLPHGHTLIGAWGRGAANVFSNSIKGWARDFSHSGVLPRYFTPTPFCEVVPGTLTSNSVTLKTYIYDFRTGSQSGPLVGTFPASSPSNVTNWQYTLLTKNNNIKFTISYADTVGNQTIILDKDTIFTASDEESDYYVRDSSKVILLDSATLELPDNYTLHFVGKTTSLKMGVGSKIKFGLNSKIVFDSSASLFANGAIFSSLDTSEKWEGIILSNSGKDSITNCTFSNAKQSLKFTNNDEDYLFEQRIIRNNTFNVPNGGVCYGINAENCYNLTIQDNTFNMPASSSYNQIGVLLKNNSTATGTIQASGSEHDPAIDGEYILNIVNNSFNNGAASLMVANYTSNLLPYFIANNTFNYASQFNMFLMKVNGTIKNNYFSSTSTPNAVHIFGGNPTVYKNNIKSSGVTLQLSGYCYPNLSPQSSDGELIWSGGNNTLYSHLNDNIHLNTASNCFTDFGHNTFETNSGDGYHIYGLVDSSVTTYYSRENCWLNVGPHISLKHSANSNPINAIHYNYGYNCSRELVSPVTYDILNMGYGVRDTIISSDDNTGSIQYAEDVLFEQAIEYLMNGSYTEAITNYKELINNYPASFYLETALYDIYYAYEALDTTADQETRDILYGNLYTYLEDRVGSELYGYDFIFIATDISAMCKANMEEYDDAMNTYEFLSLFHPDPDIRLMASWNYQEIESLIGSGGGGGEKESAVNEEFVRNKLSENTEHERISKIVNDDPILRKLKESYEKISIERQNKLEKQARSESKNDEEFNASIKKLSEKDRLKQERAKNNLFELKTLSEDQLEKRRLEDLFSLSKNLRNESSTDNNTNLPLEYKLSQNYPNPFNPTTTISFEIPTSGLVILKIYDITGREVAKLVNEIKPKGKYNISFDGANFASGVYFYKIESNKFIQVKRMVLIK